MSDPDILEPRRRASMAFPQLSWASYYVNTLAILVVPGDLLHVHVLLLLDIWPNIRQGPCLQFERLVYYELRFVAVNVNGLYLGTVFHGNILAPPYSHNSPPH